TRARAPEFGGADVVGVAPECHAQGRAGVLNGVADERRHGGPPNGRRDLRARETSRARGDNRNYQKTMSHVHPSAFVALICQNALPIYGNIRPQNTTPAHKKIPAAAMTFAGAGASSPAPVAQDPSNVKYSRLMPANSRNTIFQSKAMFCVYCVGVAMKNSIPVTMLSAS